MPTEANSITRRKLPATVIVNRPGLTWASIRVSPGSTVAVVERESGANLWVGIEVDGHFHPLVMWKHTVGSPEHLAQVQAVAVEVKAVADEQPADEQPADEQPADEQLADELNAMSWLADAWGAHPEPADEQPADEQPADERRKLLPHSRRCDAPRPGYKRAWLSYRLGCGHVTGYTWLSGPCYYRRPIRRSAFRRGWKGGAA